MINDDKPDHPAEEPNEQLSVEISGHLLIRDVDTGEEIINQRTT